MKKEDSRKLRPYSVLKNEGKTAQINFLIKGYKRWEKTTVNDNRPKRDYSQEFKQQMSQTRCINTNKKAICLYHGQ